MNKVKLAIIGSRDFTDYDKLCKTINKYFLQVDFKGDDSYGIDEIISGAARGADLLGAKFAKENGIKLTEFPALWDVYGKSAGFRRNEDIVKSADCVLSFWNKTSRGTQNALNHAKNHNKETIIIYV